MSLSPVAFIAPNYRDYKGWWLKFYTPATTTPKTIFTDSNGAVSVAKLQLNADGFIVSAGGAIVTPYISGAYDAYLFRTEALADANDTTDAVRVADDMGGALAESIAVFDNVAEMKSSGLEIGQTVLCKRYYASGELVEGLLFNIVGAGTGTANGGTFHDLDNGLQAELLENKTLNIKQFGAKGDGITDDVNPVNLALSSLSDGGVLEFSADTFYCSNSVNIPVVDNITINLKGGTIEIDGGYEILKYVDAGGVQVTLSTTDIARNSQKFTCNNASDASSFGSGDLVLLTTNTLWYQDDRGNTFKGELHIVDYVLGSEVFIRGGMYDSYDVSTELTRVQKLNKIENLTVKNGTLLNNQSLATSGGVNVYSLVNSRYENLIVDGHSNSGLFVKYGYNVLVDGCTVLRANNAGLGYGLQTSGASNVHVTNSYFFNCRRGVDWSGNYPSHSCMVTNCIVEGGGKDTNGNDMIDNAGNSAYGSHATSVGALYDSNTIINCRLGFNARGFGDVITNNVMRGTGDYFVAATFGSDLVISGNTYYSNEYEENATTTQDDTNRLRAFILKYLKSGMGSTTITNNSADKVEQAFLQLFNGEVSGDAFDNIDVTGNTCRLYGGSGNQGGTNKVFFLENLIIGTTFELQNCRFKNNSVGRVSASTAFETVSDGITINTNALTSCVFEGLPLTSSTLEVYAGAGTLSATSLNLYADILETKTHIYGSVNLTLTGSASNIRITNMPDFINGEVYRAPITANATLLYAGYTGLLSAISEVRLSDSIGTISGTIPTGTYTIPLDYSYRNQVIGFY